MNGERIARIRGSIGAVMNHGILFMFFVTIMGILDITPTIWIWLLCGLYPVWLQILRRKAGNFIWFVMGHILPVVIFFFLPADGVFEKGALLAGVIFHLAHSVFLRIKTEDWIETPVNKWVAVGAAALLFIMENTQGQKNWEAYFVIPLVIFLVLNFVLNYLEQYEYFLLVNKSSSGSIPQKEMFRCGIRSVLMFSVIAMIVLMGISNVAWMMPFLIFLRNIVSFLVRLLTRKRGNGEVPEEVGGLKPEEMTEDISFVQDHVETFWLWEVLEKVMMFGSFLLAAAICMYGLYRLFLFCYARFQEKIVVKEAMLDSVNDVREKCDVDQKSDRQRKGIRGFFAAQNPREKIRRLYKKEVWNSRKMLGKDADSGMLSRMTAAEWGRRMDKEILAGYYEKARYADEDCTAEDVRNAKGQ